MKMFRHISLILVVAALAGCAKTEFVPTPEKEVTFAVGSYAPDTKTSSLLDVDGRIESFRSQGFLHAEGISTVQNFFGTNGETISYNGTSLWQPSHTYYWPKSSNSYINFVSWYDKNGDPDSISDTHATWTIDGTTRTLRADDNIMFADVAWHYNQNTTPATYGHDNVSEGVPTLFHHAMSQVRVQARLQSVSSTSTFTVSVRNFRLTNVFNTGSLDLNNTEPAGTTPATQAWSGSWSTENYTATNMSGLNNVALSTTATDVFSLQTMIPQSTETINAEFEYAIRTTFSNGDYIEETVPASVNLFSFTGDSGQWNMNSRITYTIVINPETYYITLVPVLTEDWGEAEYITVPVEPDEE